FFFFWKQALTKLLRSALTCNPHWPRTCGHLASASNWLDLELRSLQLFLLLVWKSPARALCDTDKPALFCVTVYEVSGFLLLCSCFKILSVCITRGSLETRRGLRVAGIAEIDGCELPCRCWELNLGPLEEQQVLLTTEPSLQSELPELVYYYYSTPRYFDLSFCMFH
ncbi:mCG113792, isoform CRA_a, partial [Mus musculus]